MGRSFNWCKASSWAKCSAATDVGVGAGGSGAGPNARRAVDMLGETRLDGDTELGEVRREGSGTGEAGLCGPETERRDPADLRFCNAGSDLRRAPKLDRGPAIACAGGVAGIGGIGGSAGTGGI